VNWRFKVRDIHGQTLAEKQGRTLDGKIEWNWDLRDKKGVLHDTLEGDPYFESTITVWGDAEEKGSELLLQVARRQGKWWSRVLGRDYKRKQLSHAERERRFVTQEESPLESRVVVRPADLQNR
jgi:hypothetical protein